MITFTRDLEMFTPNNSRNFEIAIGLFKDTGIGFKIVKTKGVDRCICSTAYRKVGTKYHFIKSETEVKLLEKEI